jgi:hypothetical protein
VRRDTAGALARLANVWESRRYAVLFYALLLTLAAAPLLTAVGFAAEVLQIFLAFNLLIALLGFPGRRWRLMLGLAAAVAMALRVAPASTVDEEMATGALVAVSGIALLTIAATIRFALRATTIDAEHIYAALSAYLLAGLFFGVLHWAMAIAWPGSLAEASPSSAPGGVSLSTAIYYSFVTLATLGYGDVVPKTELARGLAVLEAVGGQLYIAVTIARLVGAHLQTPGTASGHGD